MDWRKLKNNPFWWEIFHHRQEILTKTRLFFHQEGFLEVETPVLSPYLIPESYLEVFETELKDKQGQREKAFLTPSPEMWHKKLLAAGSGNIFEITKSFRNTDLGGHFHNPEFTLLEWYRVKADYWETMKDCENLVRFLNQGRPIINYQQRKIDIRQPFERISVVEAFARYAAIKEEVLFSPQKLKKEAIKRGYSLTETDSWEIVYNLLYLKEVEPKLGWKRPVFIYDFPAQFAPLARINPDNPRVKQRFELYLFGIELADGYNELVDPEEQKKQLIKEQKRRLREGKIRVKPDRDFIAALTAGLPPCSGVALGMDRLVMIFTNRKEIGEVILFAAEEIF